MTRKPADPEEELRWMSQEVRGYVEAVLNSLAANVPKVIYVETVRNHGSPKWYDMVHFERKLS